MKSFVFSVFFSIGLFSSLNAQFDRYDFVVVPTKFDVFFEPNAYRTSTLLKFLLTEAGYEAYYEDELTEYALQNPCKGIKIDLEESSAPCCSAVRAMVDAMAIQAIMDPQ